MTGKVGRELDAEIATRVFGWREVKQGHQWNYVQGCSVWHDGDEIAWNGVPPDTTYCEPFRSDYHRVPYYSSSRDRALTVIDKLQEMGLIVSIDFSSGGYNGPKYNIRVLKPSKPEHILLTWEDSDHFAEAVCVVALGVLDKLAEMTCPTCGKH